MPNQPVNINQVLDHPVILMLFGAGVFALGWRAGLTQSKTHS